jgi:hypothetical protein
MSVLNNRTVRIGRFLFYNERKKPNDIVPVAAAAAAHLAVHISWDLGVTIYNNAQRQ